MSEVILDGTGVLYHVTPSENAKSIDQGGILPELSSGKMLVSWYVNRANIQWAVLHVSMKYNVSVLHISVCAVVVDWKHMKRTCCQGRYYTYKSFKTESFTPASYFVES